MPSRRRGQRKHAEFTFSLDREFSASESAPDFQEAADMTETVNRPQTETDTSLVPSETHRKSSSANKRPAETPRIEVAKAFLGASSKPEASEQVSSTAHLSRRKPSLDPKPPQKHAISDPGRKIRRRRRRIFRGSVEPSLRSGDIRRMCRRAGVLRMSGLLQWEVIGVLNFRLQRVLRDCAELSSLSKRSTVTRGNVCRVLRGNNSSLYPAQ